MYLSFSLSLLLYLSSLLSFCWSCLANLSQILHLPPHCCTECKSQWWRPCWSPWRAPLLYPACKISISQKGKNHILHYHYVKATCYWAYSQLRNTAGPPREWEEQGSVWLSLFLSRGKDEAAPRPWRYPVRSGLKMILILIFNMNAPAKSIVNSETFKSACPPKASIVHRYVNANLIWTCIIHRIW